MWPKTQSRGGTSSRRAARNRQPTSEPRTSPIAGPPRRPVADQHVDLRDQRRLGRTEVVVAVEGPAAQVGDPGGSVEGQPGGGRPLVEEVGAATARLPPRALAGEVVIAGDPDDLGVGQGVHPRVELLDQPGALERDRVIAERADVPGDHEDVAAGQVGGQVAVQVGDRDEPGCADARHRRRAYWLGTGRWRHRLRTRRLRSGAGRRHRLRTRRARAECRRHLHRPALQAWLVGGGTSTAAPRDRRRWIRRWPRAWWLAPYTRGW